MRRLVESAAVEPRRFGKGGLPVLTAKATCGVLACAKALGMPRLGSMLQRRDKVKSF